MQVKVFAPPAPPGLVPPTVVPPTPAAQPTPETTIGRHPKLKAAPTFGVFTFSSDQSPVSFECQLDTMGFKPCKSPFNTNSLKTRKVGKGKKKLLPAFKLKKGSHTLQVRAVAAGGRVDPTPAEFKWRVGRVAKKHRASKRQ